MLHRFPANRAALGSQVFIGRASRLTGLTQRAIRLYEDRGLVEGRRDGRGRRSYAEADLQRLMRIAQLRAIGVGLQEIAVLVDGTEQQLETTLRARRALLKQQLEALERLEEQLGEAPRAAAG